MFKRLIRKHIFIIYFKVLLLYNRAVFRRLSGKRSINTLLIKLLNKRRKKSTSPAKRHLFDDMEV